MEYTEYDTRLAAYVVVVDGDQILLSLWNEPEVPRWTMPGGGVELHEDIEAGAIREVREETGYDVELTGLLGVDWQVIAAEQRFHRTDRPVKALRVIYGGRVVGGELRHEIDGTTDEARWIPLADVPDLRRVSLVDTAIELWRNR